LNFDCKEEFAKQFNSALLALTSNEPITGGIKINDFIIEIVKRHESNSSLFDGILDRRGGDPIDFLSGLYDVLTACGMPITFFGAKSKTCVFVPNKLNWLDSEYEDEIIKQIAHDAECIIIVPDKYPDLRNPSEISLPLHGNIKIGSNHNIIGI
jgi:hypothetical protein